MDFVSFCQEHSIPYKEFGEHHHVTTGWVQIDCPMCSPNSESYRLGYNLAYGNMSCWSCGKVNPAKAICEILNIDMRRSIELLGKLDKMSIGDWLPEMTNKLVLPDPLFDLTTTHEKYLQSRNLDPRELVRLWSIQATGRKRSVKKLGRGVHTTLAGRPFPWAIFIPIHYHGKILSWTSRAIGDTGRRYLSASREQERVSHKDLLYGEDYCRTSIIIHEGPFDVFRIGPGTCCTFGTTVTPKQFQRILRYPKRYVCFDNTDEAQMAAKGLIRALAPFEGETYNITLDEKDAGEATDKTKKQLRRLIA